MIRSEYHNHGLVLTIDRAEQRNALSVEMYGQLQAGLQQAHDNPDCHSVIIRGSGGVFTAGNDLKDFQQPRQGGDSAGLSFLRTLISIDVPVIAAVEGYAIGIGATLLQHCDFVYADDSAFFSLPFVSMGLCPEGGSSQILERIAGRRKASEWLLLGERFTAREAAEAGLLTALSEPGQTMADARATAAKLAEKPVQALRLTKRMLREPGRAELMAVLDSERELFRERLNSEEAQQVFRNFFERSKK
ncbi:enoyl-CoA hydratase-related protein [Achromobacter sp. F4_2707]|uniref:enoyl-CoA hydratase-related protein n=1 Tax=Achromobacter sp. F4_2707 TaxID=3114286 RepID=UPI0039C6DF60